MKIEVDCPRCGAKLDVRCTSLDMLGGRTYEAVLTGGQIDLFEHAKASYLRLLKQPLNSWERHYNQSYLAFLRNFIAVMENRDQEEVQNEYEAKANEH